MHLNIFFKKLLKISLLVCTYNLLFLTSPLYSDAIKNIIIEGNDRISNETIVMFSGVTVGQNIENNNLNDILNKLYETNFFNDVKTSFKNQILLIKVEENPVIGNIEFTGIKAKKIKKSITKDLKLKPRSSYNSFLLEKDKEKLKTSLKNLGYYASSVDIFLEEQSDNIVNISYKIDLGDKAKIKKITINGNKIFKDNKLKSIIISEEYKFWKFISGKKYLNEKMILMDSRLLRNFYLNKGYYNVRIRSSFAKLIDKNNFELIFNIDADEKFYFDKLDLVLPSDFDKSNFKLIDDLFFKLKGQPYSINRIEKIIQTIDIITTNEQYVSTKATVTEDIQDNKINLNFIILETEKVYVDRINILGNNITREDVIRNQLELDEGDPFNEILLSKSINNLKSLNFFKDVKFNLIEKIDPGSKSIDIIVQEKPTGEIMAGAGFGTSGTTTTFGVKENNYLGKGLSVDAKFDLSESQIKGKFSVTNPNYNNTDKSLSVNIQALETDKLKDFGYKTNKTGFTVGTTFDYYDDFNLGLGINSFFETIETDSTASSRQKNQAGDYFDNFLSVSFDYDKRNQKFQTSDGFRNFYATDIPLISETNTLSNTFISTKYIEFFDKNIFKSSFYFKNANSITGENIKLTERLTIPASRLRGFEQGKVGPKDGNDYIGGNFITAINFSSTLPQILENSQSTDFKIFLDVANVWGVDYDTSLDNSEIRSSIGFGLDWFSPIGPMNFSLSQPISKTNTDVTETFRFNLGTTF
tara:strand:+ start:235 stop:2499 length:2265 start_codon:yes stop_codon:yes gene_type:complete